MIFSYSGFPPSQTVERVKSKAMYLSDGRMPLDSEAGRRMPTEQGQPSVDEINTLLTLFSAGRYSAALSRAERMTLRFPQHGLGWKVLGATLRQMGQSSNALTPLQNAAALLHSDAGVQVSLGNTLKDMGRLDEAEASYRRALEIRPDLPEAYFNQGNVLQDLGRLNEAEASYRRALAFKPGLPGAHLNLGNTLQDLGRLGEAEASYRRALQFRPDYAKAQINLGNVLKELGRPSEAEASFRRALEIKPDAAEAHCNLGMTLRDMGRLDEAEACLRNALAVAADYAKAHLNLGNTVRDLGRAEEALACYRRALEIEADNPWAHLALAMNALPIAPQTVAAAASVTDAFALALQELADWLASSPLHQANLADVLGTAQPFYLAYRAGNHVQLLSRYGDLIAAASAAHNVLISRGSPRRKLRLVIVSRHFYRHSVWDIILRGLLLNIDRQKFEVMLYHVGQHEDGETKLARSLADAWRDAHTVFGFNGWLAVMAADQPDIIFYPEIGMDTLTLRLAALRLAPLQVASWGHPIGTGLPTMDAYFSAELLEPADADAHYRERLVRLPGTGCCTMPIAIEPEAMPELEADPGLQERILFLIAQRSFKFDPADDALYADIAANVKDSTFLLMRDPNFSWATDLLQARLSQVFRARGLAPEQHLRIISWLSRERFYRLLELSHVYLDCPSFSGYTTAWQAIHRGLPVVTLEGKFMRQRLAAGLLRKTGLAETIAADADHYVNIASSLAEECRDPVRRHARRDAIKAVAHRMDNDLSVVRAFEQNLIDLLAQTGR